MKIKRIILKLFLFTLIFFNAVSDEINFEAKNIELKQNGKILLAYDSNLQLPSKNISIDSKKAEYNKIKIILKLLIPLEFRILSSFFSFKSK